MADKFYITGPLGLWPFPVLNMIMARLSSTPPTTTAQSLQVAEWFDWKGRPRTTAVGQGYPGIQTGHIIALGRSQVTVG